MTETAKLFNALFTDADTVQIRVLHEREKRAYLNRLFHSPGEAAGYLEKNAAGIEKKNAFPCVGVNPREMSAENEIAQLKNIVVDIDGAPLPEWAAERADVICSRDDSHHHLYFCFSPMGNTAENRKKYSETVKALLALTGSKEKAAHDPERIIRLPGFSHGKTGKPAPGYRVTYVRDEIRRPAFNKKFAWLKESAPAEQDLPAAPDAAPAKPDEKTAQNAIKYLKDLYGKKPAMAAGDGRSRELFFIGLDCHAWGVPQEEAERLADEINKARFTPPENIDTVRHQIASAYKYRKGEFGSLLNSAKGMTDRQQVRAKMQFEALQRARDLLSDFVYVHGAERLINRKTRFELTTVTQINNFIISRLGETVTLAELLKASALDCADVLDFAPGEPVLYDDGGKAAFNRYVQGEEPRRDPGRKKEAVQVFREHIAYLATSEAEEKTLLQFLAYIVQNPGHKLSWAPLIISRHTGIGKSALETLAGAMLGKHNIGYAESDDLTGQHTDYVAEKLLVIAHELETGDKNVMRRLKSLITEQRVRVIAKYARTYETRNCANFLFFSNRVDAVRVDDNDRRLFVIYNRREPQPQEYYDRLFDVFETAAGWVYDYLMSVDLSGFNPHARPVQTEGRDLLTKQSETELSSYLREIEEAHDGPFAQPIFTSRAVLDHVQFNGTEQAKKYMTQRAIAAWLDYRGYNSFDYYETEGDKRRHLHAWHKGDRESFDRERRKMKTKA